MEIAFKIKTETGGTYGAKKRDYFHYKHITPLELKIVGESLTPAESRVYSTKKPKSQAP